MPTWLQATLALVAPIAAIVGVLVGARATRERELQRWRLDTKRDLYLKAVCAAEAVRSCALEMVEPESLAQLKWRDKDLVDTRYGEALDRYFALMPELGVVAGTNVYEAAVDLSTVLVKTAHGPAGDSDPHTAFVEVFNEGSIATNRLTNEMRVELGFGERHPDGGGLVIPKGSRKS
ncbi:MAG: hypothetical protein M3256_19770 [Actinomycetota bacterium]|nr:hypothetical protein [Actinomycetota bacterium]